MASENKFGSNTGSNTSSELRQNLTIKGDILVDNGTYLIENVNLNLTGAIIANNDATVIIRNSALFSTAYGIIVLADESKFIAENSTIAVNSTSRGDWSQMILGDETTMNITDSELYGHLYLICKQNSRTYVKRSILKGPDPSDDAICGVFTRDNSTARIQDSELDTAQAGGNSSICIFNSSIQTKGVYAGDKSMVEIENSLLAYVEAPGWFLGNSTLHILNSTANAILFRGFTLTVEDSTVTHWVQVQGNSTAWLRSVSTSSVTAVHNATTWLINSYSRAIDTRDQGRVYVGWQLPLLGIVAVPHTWLPILQGIAVLASLALIIALLVFVNRRWKKWQLQKLKQYAQTSPQS